MIKTMETKFKLKEKSQKKKEINVLNCMKMQNI
jgi:hypothetical protein